MKYPYIGYWEATELTVLFVANREGLEIEEDENYSCEWSEHEYTNITREYLVNTYGKVESKEHADFIKLLAEINEIVVFKDSEMTKAKGINYFSVTSDGIMYFWHDKSGIQCDRKQITIPLPPKEVKEMKNNGDNLVLGCEDSKCEEWPKAGDKFIHKGELVTCISKGVTSKGDEVVTFEGADKLSHGSCWNNDVWVKKPKTPEEELRELLHLLWDENGGDFDDFVDIAIRHVTKKPQ